VQALFLTILLLSKKNKIAGDFVLTSWLLVLAILLFLYYYNSQSYTNILYHAVNPPTWLMIVNIPFVLIQSPLLFIYVSTLLKGKKHFNLIYLLHFIPVILFIILYFVIIDFTPEKKEEFNITSYKYHQIILLFFPLSVILAYYYIFKTYYRIKKYQKKILKHFSYTENIDFKWLKNLVILTAAVWTILLVLIILFKIYDIFTHIHNIVLISITIAVFLAGYFGFIKTDFLITIEKKSELNNKTIQAKKKVNFMSDEIEHQIRLLQSYMEKEKPFLDSKLTIKQLADMLSVQTYQLSNILNDSLNKNFFDFINEYRVEEVKKQIRANKNYTLLGIAYDCGFNSKSSFNRIFKNITGITPSEYLKSYSK
jgi:AraC-like DNA-binding protein